MKPQLTLILQAEKDQENIVREICSSVDKISDHTHKFLVLESLAKYCLQNKLKCDQHVKRAKIEAKAIKDYSNRAFALGSFSLIWSTFLNKKLYE